MTNLNVSLGDQAADEVSEWLQVHVVWFRALAADFVEERVAQTPAFPQASWLRELILDLVTESDHLRSTYGYAGWLCGKNESIDAARAAVSLELVHLSACLYDESTADTGVVDAIGALVLNWADGLFHEVGLPETARAEALSAVRVWRDEIAVNRLWKVIDWPVPGPLPVPVDSLVRPLQIGATLAGCAGQEIEALCKHGESVSEALRVRADLHAVSGQALDLAESSETGRPEANCVVAAGWRLATPVQRQELRRLVTLAKVAGWGITANGELLGLLAEIGAVAWAREEISRQVEDALAALTGVGRPAAQRLLGSFAQGLRC